MKNIPIKNKEVLRCLNDFLWYYDNLELVKKTLRVDGRPGERKKWMTDKYRDEIIAMDTAHEGFPDYGHSYALKLDRIAFIDGKHKTPEAKLFVEKFGQLNEQLCNTLGAKNNALTSMYPPDGFISWHNNANASAYNLIFSWSETGEGCFKYIDGHTGNEVVMQDVKGWQCKAGYFGAYGEPWYNRVYHAAETDCWRITVSYMFDRSDMSLGLQDDIVEEIMSDF